VSGGGTIAARLPSASNGGVRAFFSFSLMYI